MQEKERRGKKRESRGYFAALASPKKHRVRRALTMIKEDTGDELSLSKLQDRCSKSIRGSRKPQRLEAKERRVFGGKRRVQVVPDFRPGDNGRFPSHIKRVGGGRSPYGSLNGGVRKIDGPGKTQ